MHTPYLPTTLREASIGPVDNQRPGYRGWADFAVRLRACALDDAAQSPLPPQAFQCDSRLGDAAGIANGMLAALAPVRKH